MILDCGNIDGMPPPLEGELDIFQVNDNPFTRIETKPITTAKDIPWD